MQSELGELAELVQWTPDVDLTPDWVVENQDRLSEEIADVFIYLVRLADVLGLDVEEIAMRKIASNHERYPIEKSRGNAKKYTEFE
jgi:NTP pyrophosphatase (non-canonical NTP hydrolase)